MFESALGRSEASSSRLGTGAVLSAGVHALFAALVFIIPGKTRAQQETPPEALVIQIAQPKVDLGGSPGPAAATTATVAAKTPQPKEPAHIPNTTTPEPQQQEQEPQQPTNSDPTPGADSAATAGPPGGGAGGGPGNGPGGGTGGNGPGTGNGSGEQGGTYTVLNWNASMERPVQTAGPAHPEYPRNAMLQHREGVVLAKCRIATDGAVRDCSIIKGDVMLQQAALDALAQQHYRPFMYGGVAVSVWYNFRFTFKLQ